MDNNEKKLLTEICIKNQHLIIQKIDKFFDNPMESYVTIGFDRDATHRNTFIAIINYMSGYWESGLHESFNRQNGRYLNPNELEDWRIIVTPYYNQLKDHILKKTKDGGLDDTLSKIPR